MISKCSASAESNRQQTPNPSICHLPSAHFVEKHSSDPQPSFTTLGPKRLSEFEGAPHPVRAAFWRRLREGLAAEREIEAWLAEFAPPRSTTTHRFVGWDRSWQRRARAVRRAALRPADSLPLDRDIDPLREIPAEVYVEALTGQEVPPSRRMNCPLLDHDDSYPSCRIYEFTWNCFSCNRGGTIYELAAYLWGMDRRGRAFVELHKRLRAVFS